MLTAYGSSGGGGSALQIEVVHDPGPPLPAVIYSMANFIGHGSAMTISGLDQCGVAPAIGSVYTLAPGTTSLSGSPTLLGNPSTPQNGAMDIDIASYITRLKTGATVVTTDQNGTNFGSASNDVTVYNAWGVTLYGMVSCWCQETSSLMVGEGERTSEVPSWEGHLRVSTVASISRMT